MDAPAAHHVEQAVQPKAGAAARTDFY